MTSTVDQQGSRAHGDIVGRDKVETHYHGPVPTQGVVEKLLQKLQDEVACNTSVRTTIEALAHFQNRRSHDGIDGLEAKLKAADREDEVFEAIEKKELFAKLLERWSLYASAQEIFAYLLAKAEYEFTYVIRPQLGALSKVAANQLVHERVVLPTIEECGTTVFIINHSLAMGMIYWLAEQCFVRWHE